MQVQKLHGEMRGAYYRVSNSRPLGPDMYGLLGRASSSADFVHPGVSLGDRACLGTAQAGGYRVITAESKWLQIRRDVDVWLFR